MRYAIVIFVVCGVVPTASNASSDGISISLEGLREKYVLGEPIEVVVTLRNDTKEIIKTTVSAAGLWIAEFEVQRMDIAERVACADEGDTAWYVWNGQRPKTFAPGEKVQQQFDLLKHCSLYREKLQPGSYKIRARKRDSDLSTPWQEFRIELGEVVSRENYDITIKEYGQDDRSERVAVLVTKSGDDKFAFYAYTYRRKGKERTLYQHLGMLPQREPVVHSMLDGKGELHVLVPKLPWSEQLIEALRDAAMKSCRRETQYYSYYVTSGGWANLGFGEELERAIKEGPLVLQKKPDGLVVVVGKPQSEESLTQDRRMKM